LKPLARCSCKQETFMPLLLSITVVGNRVSYWPQPSGNQMTHTKKQRKNRGIFSYQFSPICGDG
ncbi:MAG: hypothetical protein ACK2UR_15245, partial [Candidatus Promineifilaceae bacterium]